MNTIADMGDYWLFSHLEGEGWVRFPFMLTEELAQYLLDNGLYNRACGNIRQGDC